MPPDTRTRCPFCTEPILKGQDVYEELDAPATPHDAQRACEGKSYRVVIAMAHKRCNPCATSPVDVSDAGLGLTGT